MTTDSSPTWEMRLLRTLQSWRDSAGAASDRDWLAEECAACPQDPYLAQISTTRPWPHWMRHELRDRVHALRSDEFYRALDRPFDDSTTLGDHYRSQTGEGHLAPDSDASPEAITIVDDLMTTWDLWIYERLERFANWERLMFRDIARRELRAERRFLARAAHPSALLQQPAPVVALPPLEGPALSRVIDDWIDDLASWTPEDDGISCSGRGETDRCELCADFFMIEAAGLPSWTPHALRHRLATSLAALMAEHYPYDWRTGLEPSAELLGLSEEKIDDLATATERCRVEFEDQLFRDMRARAPRLISSLESVVLPRLRTP